MYGQRQCFAMRVAFTFFLVSLHNEIVFHCIYLRNASIQLLKDVITAKEATAESASTAPTGSPTGEETSAPPAKATVAGEMGEGVSAQAHNESPGETPGDGVEADDESVQLVETPGDGVGAAGDLGNSGSSTSLDTNSSLETNMIDSGWRYDEKLAKRESQTPVGPLTDTADTLPMESEDTAWPPKPWLPKSDISRWTTTRNPQAS